VARARGEESLVSRLGLLCATPEELAALRDRLHLDPKPEVHGPTRVWRGRHDGEELLLAQMGIGKVNAAAAATLLLSLFEVEALICSGVAGGLAPDLPVGAVLLAERLAIHDYGIVAGRRFTATASGEIPIGAPELSQLPAVRPEVSAAFATLEARVADQLGHPIRRGGIVTADYFLNCAETRDELRGRFGADAIDMESGALHQVAEAWNRPLYVIRTLSDLAGEESHMTYYEMALMAAQNSALCVSELLRILKGGPETPP
jgi:adenosylhomocysteine nucleosidase